MNEIQPVGLGLAAVFSKGALHVNAAVPAGVSAASPRSRNHGREFMPVQRMNADACLRLQKQLTAICEKYHRLILGLRRTSSSRRRDCARIAP